MSDARHTFTDLEDGTGAETVGVRVTIRDGAPAGGTPVYLLAHGGSVAAGTPTGALIFEKSA
jgi:hypothetical protein